MVVAGGYHVDEIEPLGSDHPFCEAHVRLVGVCVFFGQRVGEIGIQEQKGAPVPDQKATLPQPPDVEQFGPGPGLGHVRQKDIALQQRLFHTPNSARTSSMPATIFASFCRAAHRAVWLRPQSGANESRSGGA